MTQEEWDKKWLSMYDTCWIETRSHQKAFEAAHASMRRKYGPRPAGEPGLPWWVKIAALSVGVKMSPLLARVITAVIYAITAGVAAYQAAAQPITTEGWIGLGIAVIVAFWGKFSTSTSVVAANREGESFGGPRK